jgi:regulator of nonsense transcripts 1
VPGDELRLRYPGDSSHPTWQSVGHVVCVLELFIVR